MNDKGKPKEFLDALRTIRQYSADEELRGKADQILGERARGKDITREHMKNLKFQCLECYEVFETEKGYRTHAGMHDSTHNVIREQMNIFESMNVIDLGP